MDDPSPILIAGMHRSGTSMVTRLLNLCGLNLGADDRIMTIHNTNEAGFWENEDFVNLNDLILERLGFAWDLPPVGDHNPAHDPDLRLEYGPAVEDIVGNLRQAIQEGKGEKAAQKAGVAVSSGLELSYWGWKDPRNSLLLPFWRGLFPDLKVVVCLRNPLEVAVSLQNRSGSSEIFGLDLWFRYHRRLLADLNDCDHLVTHYAAFFINPAAELRRILDWLDWQVSDDQVHRACATVKRRLRHSNITTRDLKASPCPAELISLYHELCRAAGPNCQQALQETETVADQKPRVSIVIPVFNKLSLTRQCLRVLKQRTPRGLYELIIVDNGSTDGTAHYLRSQERHFPFRAIINQENRGFAGACNQGAAAARGNYILFLNNDTEPYNGWLEPLVTILDRDPPVAAVGSKLLFPDNTVQHGGVAVIDDQSVGEPIGARHLSYRKPANSPEVNRPLFLQAITAACMLIRKESFQAVGGFDEGYWNGYEDVDLCFKLQQRSWQIVYEPRSVLLHHESQSGPERFSRWPQNVERLQERWLGKIQPDFTIQKDRSIVEHDHGGIRAYQRPGEKKVPDRVASSGDRPRDTRHRDKRHRGQISKPKKLTSIVVLCYQALAYTKQCVASLLDHTGGDFEIILVDNGSDDGTPSYLRQVADEHSNCHLIENGENLGYAAGNNQGVAAARGEYIVLINNDVIVTDGWLDRLLYSAERDPKVGIVGPMTNRISGTQMLPEVNYDTETLAGLGKFAADLANKQSHIAVPNWRAVGFCVLIKRDVFTKIGGLDERFGRGNFEDDDFCIRAMLAGFETRLATDCFVHHYGSQSFVAARVDYEQCLRENWDIFKNKWGIPAEVEYGASYDFTPHLQGGFDPAKHYCPLPTEVITDGKASPETRIFPGDEATKLADGEELFRAGRLTEAGVAFREILAAKPHHGRARNNLACVLWQEGATEDAITELSRILARDPDNRDAAWNLGQFLHGLGHLNEAKQLYEAFAQRHPEDEELVAALTRWREHTTPQTASITKAGKATEPVQAKTPLSSTNLEAR